MRAMYVAMYYYIWNLKKQAFCQMTPILSAPCHSGRATRISFNVVSYWLNQKSQRKINTLQDMLLHNIEISKITLLKTEMFSLLQVKLTS